MFYVLFYFHRDRTGTALHVKQMAEHAGLKSRQRPSETCTSLKTLSFGRTFPVTGTETRTCCGA